jgi:hypothetical protein
MTKRQRGLSLMNLVIGLAVVGFLVVMGAKLLPSYIEYYNVKKVLASMEQAGTLKGTVREIRYDWEKRIPIDDIRSVRGEDLEISKAGGETVVTAAWSVKIPLVGNASACLDFVVTTAK